MSGDSLDTFVGKNLEVVGADGSIKSGKCLSIDPVSRTFVLLNKTSLIVLPWISAENGSITCLSDDLVLAEEKLFNYFKELIQHRRPPPLNKEALRIRKSALQSYLKENYFENESQEETIVIADGLGSIDPPYSVLECQSRQQVVLRKLTDLVKEFDSINS